MFTSNWRHVFIFCLLSILPLFASSDGITEECGRLLSGPADRHTIYVYCPELPLMDALGRQSDLPYIWAEVAFAVTADLATTVDDVLSRRVPLLLVGRDQGLDVAARVADVAGDVLGWDAERRSSEIERYQKSVANSRLYRKT